MTTMTLKKKIFSFMYIYILAIICLCVWLLAFLTIKGKINLNFNVEDAGLITIGFIAFLVLALIKDSFYIVPIICYLPFTFSRAFEVNSIPISLYIIIAFALLGIILHIILYREKIKLGKFIVGLAIFVLGTILGGLNNNNSVFNFFAIAGIAIGVLFLYSFIVTYLDKHEFKELCHIMTAIGLILVAQTLLYQFIIHKDAMFQIKDTNVGWGCTNNIAIILLMCIPFTMYLTLNSKNTLSLFALVLTFIFCLGILLNFSRGAVLSACLVFPVAIIYSFFRSKSKLLYMVYLLIICIVIVAIYIYISKTKPELLDKIIDNVTLFDSSSLNGRKPIYDRMLEEVKDKIIFGVGLLNSFDPSTSTYGWGHNVFIHTVYTMGLFGLITILIHMFQKYYLLIKKPSVKKIFVLFSFIASGLYGLMDVGYYFINFMVVLVAILALIEYEIDVTI